ncbi:hypothetical protein MPSEU_000035500 [Mayamaea pseudoterrestris]|nr:hypothetical protein MPSEU_000035500 [Mayamaea pseudoterrestris]
MRLPLRRTRWLLISAIGLINSLLIQRNDLSVSAFTVFPSFSLARKRRHHLSPTVRSAGSHSSLTPTHSSTSTILSAASSSSSPSSISSSTLPSSQPPVLSIENLSCSHDGGENWQLKDVSYVLQRGAKVALVGRNGAGKSTFLKILADQCVKDGGHAPFDVPYAGTVSLSRTARVAYVEQEPLVHAADLTVGDALFGMTGSLIDDAAADRNGGNSNNVFSVVRRYRLASAHAELDPTSFTEACADMDRCNGWQVLTRAEMVADKLRVWYLRDSKLSQLSGGEVKRVALAAALVQDPDVLALDEPTNFLSLAGVQWLSDLLTSEQKKLTILMVTHDRIFLDEVCDRILELDNGQVYEYMGKYADYLQGKQDRLALESAAAQAVKAKYRVELDWMRRQPQARQTKAKARIDAFYKLQQATKPKPLDPSLSIDSNGKQRLGSKILSMRNVNLTFGDRAMLNDFSYDFCRGDRICLSGANGVGKTTLVRVITGQQPPDSGAIEMGDTVVLGLYDQMGISIDHPQQTVLEFVMEKVQSATDSYTATAADDARKLLQRFEFSRQRWNDRVSVLSGGEKRRLQMLSVFSKKPNFFIMDEPSVDCDLDTLSALESFLQEFDGVLLLVSHDRAFADKVTDHLFIFEGAGEIKDFIGTLSEYASTLIDIENDSISRQSGVASDQADLTTDKSADYRDDKAARNQQRNALRQAKKEVDNLEKQVARLMIKAAKVQKKIDDSSAEGWSVLADLTEELATLNIEIKAKELRWMELAEELENADPVA